METTTTEKPYQKYPDDATPLVFFLGAVFAVCLIYYIFKLYKCLQGKARGDSPSTNTSSSGIKPKCSTNYLLICFAFQKAMKLLRSNTQTAYTCLRKYYAEDLEQTRQSAIHGLQLRRSKRTLYRRVMQIVFTSHQCQ